MVRFLKRYFWIWSSNRKGYYRECKAATGRDCNRIAIPGEGLALILNCAMGAPVSRPKVNEAVTSPPKAAQDAVDRTIENSLETPERRARRRVTSFRRLRRSPVTSGVHWASRVCRCGSAFLFEGRQVLCKQMKMNNARDAWLTTGPHLITIHSLSAHVLLNDRPLVHPVHRVPQLPFCCSFSPFRRTWKPA